MPEQREKDRAREIGSPLQRHSGEKARHDLSDWPLCCWPLAAEKLPTHQNEDDAASAAEFSFRYVGHRSPERLRHDRMKIGIIREDRCAHSRSMDV